MEKEKKDVWSLVTESFNNISKSIGALTSAVKHLTARIETLEAKIALIFDEKITKPDKFSN